MQFEPGDLLQKLEFDKILDLLKNLCYGELGRKAVGNTGFETVPLILEGKLQQVHEFKISIEKNDNFPFGPYEDIAKDLRMLEIVDFVLSEDALKRIVKTLHLSSEIFSFFTELKQSTYAELYKIVSTTTYDNQLANAIDKVIDDESNIRPDASPELLKIRRGIISKQQEMEKQFRSLISRYRTKGWLTDTVESFRNGRRVLSAPSEHKRKIRGIIHDESTTGKTAFIEPEEIIEINNDIFDLETEEKREIYRILKELSQLLRPYISLIKKYLSILTHFDVVQAKARFAFQINGIMPKMVKSPHLGIQMGYHPLLLLKNKKQKRETVPFDLSLYGKNRILMLSGPNAGGKSITMKSVGLLQLMYQSGMLIPVDEISEMGVFEKLFSDIGDQQSLEDDLSTYSSRLENMRVFLEKADDKSLVLIDEFGSGTDPKIGGAIAEAILHEMNRKKVYGVLTTHYSNLKIYAFQTEGLVNGSMLFDKDHLSPTYELKVGRPGSSYAFEIAEKSGLNKNILKYAKRRTGRNEKAVDQLLIDLQREKQELSEQLLEISDKQKALDKLIKNYEELHKNLEFRRKKLKLESREQALQLAAQENKEYEKLIREIREEKNLEKAKEKAQKVREERKQLVEEVTDLKNDIYYKPAKSAKDVKISEGDFVRLITGGATGVVEKISKKKAVVLVGQLRMTINLRDLQAANAPLEVQSSKGVKFDTVSKNANFESKIDIRGMHMEEALQVIQDFMDQALISNTSMLRIIHGKGNGILRKVVRKKLREYQAVSSIRHPEQEFGGDGVTIVELGG